MATGKDADEEPVAVAIEYPLRVEYCGICTLPPEVILGNSIKGCFSLTMAAS